MTKIESPVFSHAIVIDFEATCYDKLERPPDGWRSEIVEFPAVLVKLDTGTVLDEFHRFVRPTETPELSRFCCKFLHLEKDQLNDEEPLESVLDEFNQWMGKVRKEHNLSLYHVGHEFTNDDNVTCIITWTDWDIGIQLKEEAKRKHIRLPTPIKSWVDLRSIARRHLPPKYGHVPRLRKMFDVMGVTWEGKQHSGIVDARNTAKLALKFVDKLRITRTIGVIGRVAGDKYRFLCEKMMNSELEEAQAEWDAIVETQHLKLVKDEVPFEVKTSEQCIQLIIAQMEQERQDVKATVLNRQQDESCFDIMKRSLFGPPYLAETERDSAKLLLQAAKTPLSSLPDSDQSSILGTIYANFTGGSAPPGRYGSHWELIGFQGNDPGTDLRGVGLFGLWLIVLASERSLDLYHDSLTFNFPHCTTLLTLCKATLTAFRQGRLNQSINQSNTLTACAASFNQFHDEFQRQWNLIPPSNRDVAKAGELSRKIDATK